jgi:hypothetical protein
LETNNLIETLQTAAADAQDEQATSVKRRRRRRRNKGTVAPQPQAQAQGSIDLQAQADMEPAEIEGAIQSEQQQDRGGKRRKRNRRKKNKQAQQQQPSQQQAQNFTPQPRPNEQAKFFGKKNFGQNAGANSGGRRNRQRRGGQGFVGPMDHLYRGTDNLADSTIGVNGNYRQPTRNQNAGLSVNGNIASYAETVTVPIRDDAPTRVFCFIDDLFFHAKIRETARAVGIKVEFVKSDKEQIERVIEVAAHHPILVIVDLNNLNNAKPIALIKKLRPKLSKASSLIGFVSHVQGELKMEAQEAGCDVVMPRSAFSSNLPNILRRYLDENEDEPNFNTEGALGY